MFRTQVFGESHVSLPSGKSESVDGGKKKKTGRRRRRRRRKELGQMCEAEEGREKGRKKWGGREENRDLLMSKEKGEEGGKRKGCWTTTRGNGNIFP